MNKAKKEFINELVHNRLKLFFWDFYIDTKELFEILIVCLSKSVLN